MRPSVARGKPGRRRLAEIVPSEPKWSRRVARTGRTGRTRIFSPAPPQGQREPVRPRRSFSCHLSFLRKKGGSSRSSPPSQEATNRLLSRGRSRYRSVPMVLPSSCCGPATAWLVPRARSALGTWRRSSARGRTTPCPVVRSRAAGPGASTAKRARRAAAQHRARGSRDERGRAAPGASLRCDRERDAGRRPRGKLRGDVHRAIPAGAHDREPAARFTSDHADRQQPRAVECGSARWRTDTWKCAAGRERRTAGPPLFSRFAAASPPARSRPEDVMTHKTYLTCYLDRS